MNGILIGFLSLTTSIALCQTYHQPAEIFKILNDSKVSYEIAVLEIPDVKTVEYPPQLDHGLYLKKSSDGKLVLSTYQKEYAGNKDFAMNLAIAESAFAEGNATQARESYLKALAIAPFDAQIMTFVGQTYEKDGNDSLASIWYTKAIDENYFDYMAHWFLADVYARAGVKEKALTEILTAKILNPNNPRLQEALQGIYKSSKLSYIEWEFTPRYELKNLGNNKVSLKYDQRYPEWLPYAMCKAIWQFEPGYRDSMLNNTKDHPAMVEEKECVFNILIGLQNSKTDTKDVALQIAQKALDEKMFAQYLAYEVILPKNPKFVFNLSREFIEQVVKYLLKFRSK